MQDFGYELPRGLIYEVTDSSISEGENMLSPQQRRYAERIRGLIEEGKGVAQLEQPSQGVPYIKDKVLLTAWLVKVHNVVDTTFGSASIHRQQLSAVTQKNVSKAYQVNSIVGLLSGALDDLENGFLLGQEFIISAEVFDSVLEQAKHINGTGYKDPAAVLVRVVLEDSLKRLARQEALDDSLKASRINDELKKAGKYAQPQWRRIQAWLDTGNAAAHGKFDEYNQKDVEKLIDEVEMFIAIYFSR